MGGFMFNIREGKFELVPYEPNNVPRDAVGMFQDKDKVTLITKTAKPDAEALAWVLIAPGLAKEKIDELKKEFESAGIFCQFVNGDYGDTALFLPFNLRKEAIEILKR
jgi:hypothetical protein